MRRQSPSRRTRAPRPPVAGSGCRRGHGGCGVGPRSRDVSVLGYYRVIIAERTRMAGANWLLELSAGDQAPVPSCPDLVAEAATVLGPGPAGWAVRTAACMAEEIIDRVPEHGGGAVQVDLL